MRENVTLSTGRVVCHRPYLSAGEPNGATEAYIRESVTINGVTFAVEKPMTNDEWREYVNLFHGGK